MLEILFELLKKKMSERSSKSSERSIISKLSRTLQPRNVEAFASLPIMKVLMPKEVKRKPMVLISEEDQ